MNQPEKITRTLGQVIPFEEHVVVDYTFGVDFRSSGLTISGRVQTSVPKTASFLAAEAQAFREFRDMLKAAVEKCDSEISN